MPTSTSRAVNPRPRKSRAPIAGSSSVTSAARDSAFSPPALLQAGHDRVQGARDVGNLTADGIRHQAIFAIDNLQDLGGGERVDALGSRIVLFGKQVCERLGHTPAFSMTRRALSNPRRAPSSGG